MIAMQQLGNMNTPDLPVPEHIPSTHVYKLEPLPFGCSPQQLADWSAHVGWKIRPLRATGPKAWQVCSGCAPPQATLAFNGQPLLVRHLPPRSAPSNNAIVAGPRNVAGPTSSASSSPTQAPFFSDPWAQWKGPRPTPGPTSAATVRALEGPAEKKFQQQDERIAGLEEQIKKISIDQEKQGISIASVSKSVSATEERLSKQLTHGHRFSQG